MDNKGFLDENEKKCTKSTKKIISELNSAINEGDLVKIRY